MANHKKLVNCLKDIGDLRSDAFGHTPKLSPSVSTPDQIAEHEQQLTMIIDELQYRIDLMKEAMGEGDDGHDLNDPLGCGCDSCRNAPDLC